MSRFRLLALFGAMTTLTLPAAFLLPGCSGGNGGGLITNPTPAPTNLVTNAPIRFSATQTGTLTLSRTGNNVTGTLTVNAPVTPVQRTPTDFTFSIPANVYNINGTFSPPRTVTLNGTFPAPAGAFTYTGTIPTATETGSYTITAGGQTVTGTIPALGSVTPTTPAPPTTPTTPAPPGNTDVQGTLTYSNVSTDFNGSKTTPLTNGKGAFSKQSNASGFALAIPINFNDTATHVRGINFTLTKTTDFMAGDSFTLGSFSTSGLANGTLVDYDTLTFRGPTFLANGGTLRIDSISATSLKITLTGASYTGTVGTNPAGKGSFKLNGSLTIPKA